MSQGRNQRSKRNQPRGGRRGGNIYTDYGIDQTNDSFEPWWNPTARTRIFPRGANGCDFNYTTDVIDAQFRFNQCAGIIDDGGSLIPRDDLRQVCQITLNEDLANAQQSYGQCRSSLPTIPRFF